MSVVITHPEQGIFVGAAIGMGFWSLWEAGGQTQAVTFVDEADARDFVGGWTEFNDPDAYGYVEVATVHEGYATVDELKEAGLEGILGELQITVPTYGHA